MLWLLHLLLPGLLLFLLHLPLLRRLLLLLLLLSLLLLYPLIQHRFYTAGMTSGEHPGKYLFLISEH